MKKIIRFILIIMFIYFIISQLARILYFYADNTKNILQYFSGREKGVYVESVSNEQSGFKINDKFLSVNNITTNSGDDVFNIFLSLKGQVVEIAVKRNKEIVKFSVLVPTNYPVEKIGFTMRDFPTNYSIRALPIWSEEQRWRFRLFDLINFSVTLFYVSTTYFLIKDKKIGYYFAYGYLILIVAVLAFRYFTR